MKTRFSIVILSHDASLVHLEIRNLYFRLNFSWIFVFIPEEVISFNGTARHFQFDIGKVCSTPIYRRDLTFFDRDFPSRYEKFITNYCKKVLIYVIFSMRKILDEYLEKNRAIKTYPRTCCCLPSSALGDICNGILQLYSSNQTRIYFHLPDIHLCLNE